jgi:HNH endonuclease
VEFPLDVDRLRDALANNRPVWVEIKNESSTSDLYTLGKSLVAGSSNPSHRLMLEPAAGDPIIHIKAAGANGKFICLSTVAENLQLVRYKRGKVYLILLRDDVHFEIPLQLFKGKFERQIRASKDGPHYPFASNLSLAQNGYLKKATSGLVALFIRVLSHESTLSEAVYPQSESEVDIDKINSRKDIPDTTKHVLVAARLGQGGFRRSLEQLWGNRCAILGFSTREILRASHIKKWSKSTDKQRLDPSNGLLLSAHLDALFDKGLISFNENGKMLVSKKLPATERRELRLSGRLLQRPWKELRSYLSIHRKTYGFPK